MRHLSSILLLTLALVAALTGCTRAVEGSAVMASMEECGPAQGAPMLTLKAQTGEPTLAVPQPAGWQRGSAQDTSLIRLVMTNASLIANRYAPTVVVTLETGPTEEAPSDLIGFQATSLETGLGATDVTIQRGRQCGFPSGIISYVAPGRGEIPGRTARVLCVVIADGAKTHLVTLTIQTTEPDDPSYIAQADLILNGVQISKS